MSTQNILELATAAAERFDLDIDAAESALRTYISQLETLEGRDIDEDEIGEEDAEFLLGCVETIRDTPATDARLDAVIDAVRDLDEHDQQREHYIQARDAAIRKAASEGAQRQRIADAAGMSRGRIQQIISAHA